MQVFGFAIVNIARDIEVVGVGSVGNFGGRHHAGISVYFGLCIEYGHNFVDVLCAKAVFVAVFEETFTCVYHKDAGAVVSVLLVNHDDTGWDTGAVE